MRSAERSRSRGARSRRAARSASTSICSFLPTTSIASKRRYQIEIAPAQRREIHTDGQTRLWWGEVPVDVFFNTTEFHERAASRARVEPFAGRDVPFLDCSDLAVFKAFFDRPKDWVDLAEMHEAGSLDVERVIGVLATYLGGADHRIERLVALSRSNDT
ncbi:MAG: hypothetical protein RIB65_06230 [Ilumatobacter fluminis]|uniref:hypothetical protein n=1 Tax=Ilumatobacter fluminis TaxID=467091 RepID=UPI0032EF39E5